MLNIKKITFMLLLFTALLFSATTEEVENYLSISKADKELIEIEQTFDSMRSSNDTSDQEINQIYSLYLEEHLSSNEIKELLTLYKTPIMQRYVTEMDMVDIPTEEMELFLLSLKENPLTTERSDIINNILKHTINEKQILEFYTAMTQRYQTKKKNKNSNDNNRTKQEEQFISIMKESTKNHLLYGTQVLSLKEMNELNSALKSSISVKASKVESEAMIYVMNTFIKNIVRKPKESKEENLSKKFI